MSWEAAKIIIGGIGTLAIFSFLIKENLFYRFFEHLFIGVASGFSIVLGVKNFLWPEIIKPMLGYDIVHFPDGTSSIAYDSRLLLYVLPMCFGLLYYFIYSKRHAWLAKLVIGFTLGYSAGLETKGFFAEAVPQIVSSCKPLVVVQNSEINWFSSAENTLFVAILISVMYYFFFSFRREAKALRGIGHAGRWFMMFSFGAFFGSTVMARMALLVERLQFLIFDWFGALKTLAGVA